MNWDDWWKSLLGFLGGGALVAVLNYRKDTKKLETDQEEKLIDRQAKRIEYLETALASSMKEVASLREEVGSLREAVNRLEGVKVSAIVVSDFNGIIREWNPAATLLLHWTQDDAVGKHVSMLIPPGLRNAQSRAFYQAIAKEKEGQESEPLSTLALTKDGRTIPVTIDLKTWEVQGERFFSAEIRRR